MYLPITEVIEPVISVSVQRLTSRFLENVHQRPRSSNFLYKQQHYHLTLFTTREARFLSTSVADDVSRLRSHRLRTGGSP
jgi:hypothetical protein